MKNLFFPLFIFALAMSSCAKDEVTDGGSSTLNSGDLVSINAYSGPITKGTDMTTTALEDDGYVLLHIDDADGLEESYEFKYDDTTEDWAQTATDKLKWSSVTFPANFYSLHDGDPIEVDFEDGYAVYDNYTVTGTSIGHKDLVYHASILDAIPTGNTLSAYHKHALSKIHLYAATGVYKVYIANLQLVNIDGKGNVTITPLSSDSSTEMGVEWTNSETTYEDYLYYDMDDYSLKTPTLLATTDGVNPIINSDSKAPMMIIPQETTAATISSNPDGLDAIINEGSYVEVIYYLTYADGSPLIGSPSVGALSNASDYIDADQDKALYVMVGFPLGHTFEPNNEYDITLGLGSNGSSGGILIKDYYVDKDGDPVSLTECEDDEPKTPIEIPDGEDGKDLFGEVDIDVSAQNWDDGTDHYIN